MPSIIKLIEKYRIRPVKDGNRKEITDVGRASYVSIWEPTKVKEDDDDDKKRYSIQLIFDRDDEESIKPLVQIAANAGADYWGVEYKKWPRFKYNLFSYSEERLPDTVDNEDKDQVERYFEEKPYLKNTIFFSARNKNQPGVVGRNAKPIMDQDEFYSGCYCRASIYAGFYTKPNKGLSLYLNNVMKWKDGDRLGGSPISAEEDFAKYAEADEDTSAEDSGF